MCSAQPLQMFEVVLALAMMIKEDHGDTEMAVIVDHFVAAEPEASGDEVLDNISRARSGFPPGGKSVPSPLSQPLCVTACHRCLN